MSNTRVDSKQNRFSSVISKTSGTSKLSNLSGELVNLLAYNNIVVLTDGASRSSAAKTAISVLRYRNNDVVAVLDQTEAGLTSQELFGVGGEIPVIASLSKVPDADALFIGIAPPGGKLPKKWKPLLLDAMALGIDIVSGLHDFLEDDQELVDASVRTGARLIDVRKNCKSSVATHREFPASQLRIHTVGHDCSVGKMVVAIEIERELKHRGEDSKFLATGQTGIMVSGGGIPADCVVADFISGAVEQLMAENESHDTLLVEGQGSLSHPSFSGVTLGLLHGCAPQGLILCYEAGRTAMKELPHVPIKPLSELSSLYASVASLRYPCKVIGVAVNGRYLNDTQLNKEIEQVEKELGLPACDVYRHGAGVLTAAVQKLRAELSE